MTMAIFSFSSCDDDKIAQTLDGIWEGEVSQTYCNYRWGSTTEFQYVDMEFYADPWKFSSGTGVEYDYTYINNWTGEAYYDYVEFRFNVNFGNIYIDYADGTRVAVYNYRLNNDHFEGTFKDYHTGNYWADFNFVKVGEWRYKRYSDYRRYTRAGEEQPLYKPRHVYKFDE